MSKKQKIYLDVKHYWQLSEEINLPLTEKNSLCAIVALKMIIDYWQKEPIDVLDLKKLVEKSGGRAKNGDWLQSAEVEALKQLGFVSWRRNWNMAKRDYDYLKTGENYDIEQLKLMQFQQYGAALPSIINFLKLQMPLIVSVKKNFEDNTKNHQIVINGYEENSVDHLYYLDPFLSDEKQEESSTVSLPKFLKYFNYQAIFAVPKKLSERFYSQDF